MITDMIKKLKNDKNFFDKFADYENFENKEFCYDSDISL